MSGKVLTAAILAAAFGAAPALADLAGPAELPPSSYKGQQYVDSRGCVFLRAGYGGQVTWVPRVTQDRKQLCGYAPSGGAVEVAEEAPAAKPAAVAAAPAPKPVAAPVEKPAAAKAEGPVMAAAAADPAPTKAAPAKAAPAPVVVDRPATATELAATSGGTATGLPQGGANYRLACPAETPVAERYAVNTGGTKVLCTRGDGSLVGANFPVLVEGTTDGHAIGYDAHMAATASPVVAGGADRADAPVTVQTSKATKSAKYPEITPPPGYKLAWKDDRLNPNRGKQSVDGFLAMDEIWTRTTPAELREDSTVKRKPVTIVVRRKDGTQTAHDGYVVSSKGGQTVEFANPAKAGKVAKSSKAVAPEAAPAAAAPKAKAAAGGYLVQVGTFGVAANAEGTAGRLKGMGLPVARARIKGGALTVVYAGPFGSASDAKAALAAARGAGFPDARIVQ